MVLSIDPSALRPGDTVRGDGFPPGTQVTLAFDGYFVAFPDVDDSGSFEYRGYLDPSYCGSSTSELTATVGGNEIGSVLVSLCA